MVYRLWKPPATCSQMCESCIQCSSNQVPSLPVVEHWQPCCRRSQEGQSSESGGTVAPLGEECHPSPMGHRNTPPQKKTPTNSAPCDMPSCVLWGSLGTKIRSILPPDWGEKVPWWFGQECLSTPCWVAEWLGVYAKFFNVSIAQTLYFVSIHARCIC